MGEKKAEVPVGKELVRMTGIMKEFPGVKALDNVKLDLYAGEGLALLGENGAGKSTLMKILSGVYQRDDGEIILFGKRSVSGMQKGKKCRCVQYPSGIKYVYSFKCGGEYFPGTGTDKKWPSGQ